MLRGRSAVAFVSSVSSGAASSRCLFGRRRRLSPLLSLRGWTGTTACSPARLLGGLQSVPNTAARLICNRRKYDHVTPLLRDVIHWLPVPFRIEYKLCLLVFQSLHGAAPEYLRDCCTGVTGQNIPRPEYTRVYCGLCQFILRGIFWPMPIHTPSGHNILGV